MIIVLKLYHQIVNLQENSVRRIYIIVDSVT